MSAAGREASAGRCRLLLGTGLLVGAVLTGHRVCPSAPPSPGLPRAGILGLEAEGRCFVYVLDCSGSMGDPAGRPLATAKHELLSSVEALGESRQFHVIFANERLSIFAPPGGRGRPIFATEENVRALRRFVDGVRADGGTRHHDALAAASKLVPDAIFLLTDADAGDDLAEDELARLARGLRGARCFVAQFGGEDGRRSPRLERLAVESGGAYRIVDAAATRRRGPAGMPP